MKKKLFANCRYILPAAALVLLTSSVLSGCESSSSSDAVSSLIRSETAPILEQLENISQEQKTLSETITGFQDALGRSDTSPVDEYTEQIRLYAEALHLLKEKPVTACYLYSVTLNKTVPVTL